jgi:hypothetical protein
MMHRLFLPVVASLAVALAIAAPAQEAGGGGSGFVATLVVEAVITAALAPILAAARDTAA